MVSDATAEKAPSSELVYALFETDKVDEKLISESKFDDDQQKLLRAQPYKREIVWRNVIALGVAHLLGLYGFSRMGLISSATAIWTISIALLGSLGVQAGAHRLWTHRAYKANFGVRLFLSLCHVMAFQNDLYEWCRDHRVHHKFSDTDADPHNASRGFFFSHVGWLLVKKHPELLRRSRAMDMSDLKRDPIVMFQRRYYIPLLLIFWAALPVGVPIYFWGENAWNAFTVCLFMRWIYTVNLTWLVNSWSHLYGYRPYDGRIAPVESSARHFLMGEGFHNFHHAFPWDYSASELGPLDVYNPCTAVIDLFAYMGWVWDLKRVSPEMVETRMRSKGDLDFNYKKRTTQLSEWVGGLATTFMPLLLIRWVQMYFQR